MQIIDNRTSKLLDEVNDILPRAMFSKMAVGYFYIDDIDRVLAQHYGFSGEELDFIINYDIKYRMGQDAGAGGEADG